MAKDRVITLKKQLETQEESRIRELKHLQRRKKASLDDEREPTSFKLDAYQKDFVDNSESANNVQSVLSAMITQIDSDKNWQMSPSMQQTSGLAHASEIDATTMADSLDDLFDEYENEINFSLKLKDRGPDPVE